MSVSGYYRHPSINRDQIVFVAEDDLWTVSSNGGLAHRLTANPGMEAFPCFSPDGRNVAFVGRDEGQLDLFVMPSEGGTARRLTFFGADTRVSNWRKDGSAVIVTSDYQQPYAAWGHLWEVPLAGTEVKMLPLGPAQAISFRPRGEGVVISRHSFDPARWKRYRGGRAGSVWVDRNGEGSFEVLVRLTGNMANPLWLGSRIFFLSDHEGVGNLYSVTPDGEDLDRHTNHQDFYARFASSDGRRIVYQCGTDLFVYDPATDRTRKVPIALPSARPQRNRRFLTVDLKKVESFSLQSSGHSAGVTFRGGAYTLPLWEGAPTRHGPVSSARQRLLAWLPGDGLVMVSDEAGEDVIVVEKAGKRRLVREDFGRIRSLHASPGGDQVAVTNHRHELALVPLDGRSQPTVIHRSEYGWISGVAWGPEIAGVRYLAFGAPTSRSTSNVFLHDQKSGESHQIGEAEFEDWGPSFDPDGKYMSFLSVRSFEPMADQHFHDFGFPRAVMAMIVALEAGTPSPFSVAHRIPQAPGAAPANGDSGESGPASIDLEALGSRVVAFPIPPGNYSHLRLARGKAFFLSRPLERAIGFAVEEPTPGAKLESWDLSSDKPETVAEGVIDFTLSADCRVIAFRTHKLLRVVPLAWKDDRTGNEKVGRETGIVSLDRIRAEVQPAVEWQQMFLEAWRLQRQHYWWETMGGIDWEEVRDRYLPLIDRVATRSEFSDLLWEMQGELGTSHAYELGGDYRPVPVWSQGHLGADLVLDRGSWKVGRIPSGDSWDKSSASPLAAPGVELRAGDRIVAVDHQPVDTSNSPNAFLVEKGGRPVTLTVRRGREKAKDVLVEPVTSERLLRYRDWVQGKRDAVAGMSDGRVGYIHVPDMGPDGFAEFHRSWKHQVDRDGLVIDVRFNRGGNVSQLLLERLLRERVGYRITRWRAVFPMPDDSPSGPMVCLTNEAAGSDGDIFSHVFKMKNLGPLIGTRTWGGVVGIWPQQSLVDGTMTTQPEFHTWFNDVGYSIENFGATPDIEVVDLPQDYARGIDRQLEVAVEEVMKLVETHEPTPDFEARPSTRRSDLPKQRRKRR
ncbi:S41 family peptidase [soil metagenome]